jgi:O-antigen ligase
MQALMGLRVAHDFITRFLTQWMALGYLAFPLSVYLNPSKGGTSNIFYLGVLFPWAILLVSGRVNLRPNSRIYIATVLLFAYLWVCSWWGGDNSIVDIVTLLKRFVYVLCLTTAPILIIERFPKYFDVLLLLIFGAAVIGSALAVFLHVDAYGAKALSRRMIGWGYGYNSIALALHHGLAIVIGVCLIQMRKIKAPLGWLACCFPFAALVLTNSRGPMVALLVCGILVFFMLEKSKVVATKKATIFGVIAGALVFAGWYWLSARGFSGRIDIWKQVWLQINQHPVFGTGYSVQGSSVAFGKSYVTHSHNVILELWRYGGLVAVLLFLWHFKTLYQFQAEHKDSTNSAYFIIFVFSLLVMLTSGWFMLDRPNYFWLGYWYPLGCLVANQVVRSPNEEETDESFENASVVIQ